MSEAEVIKKPIDCPHCKGKIDVEIERPKAKVILQETETIKQVDNNIHEHIHEPKPDPHMELAKNLPKGWNFATCKDGNCGTVVQNPNGLESKFKKCTNCGDNSNRKNAKICKTCGKKPDNPEDWDESEVDIEFEDDE